LKAETKELTLAILGGLLVLFVYISLAVLGLSPNPKTPEENQTMLEGHQSGMYFIEAEIMAKKLWPNPSSRWSHEVTDADTGCQPLGNGIWFAHGTVMEQTADSLRLWPWQVYFCPATQVPLYLQVADLHSGDKSSTLRQAGIFGTRSIKYR